MPLNNKMFRIQKNEDRKRKRITLKSAFDNAQKRVEPFIPQLKQLANQIKKKHPKISISRDQLFQLLILSAAGHSKTDAAYLSGIAPTTLHQILNEFPILRDAIESARSVAIQYALFCLFEAMKKDWRPAAWYLERARANEYGKIDQLQISGIPEEPIVVKFAKAMHEELKKRDKELRPDPAKAIEAEATVEEEPEEESEAE